ncbi:hypothetical protein V8C35DRAFT_305412 [Trichoderma chlorosporum]
MRLRPILTTRFLGNTETLIEEIPKQTPLAEKPATQILIARDFSNAPSPTSTGQLPGPANCTETNSTQTNHGLDPGAKIGLESGITLGILVVIVAIGLCVYSYSGRKRNGGADGEADGEADEDADTRSCIVEPGTPHSSMPELPIQQMYQTGGHRYAPIIPNNNHPVSSDIPILPAVPRKSPATVDQWGRVDYSSQPLMNAAELEDGYTWTRQNRMSELYSSPSTYRKAMYSRPAELDNNVAGNLKPVHLIPRKQVASHAQLPRP